MPAKIPTFIVKVGAMPTVLGPYSYDRACDVASDLELGSYFLASGEPSTDRDALATPVLPQRGFVNEAGTAVLITRGGAADVAVRCHYDADGTPAIDITGEDAGKVYVKVNGTTFATFKELGHEPTVLEQTPYPTVPNFKFKAGRRFWSQNSRFREGYSTYLAEVAETDSPKHSTLLAQLEHVVDEYAQDHSGDLVVLSGLTKGGLVVKLHDSWGDDDAIVVHVYDPDEDEDLGDPEFDKDNGAVINYYRQENAHLAFRLFLGLVAD